MVIFMQTTQSKQAAEARHGKTLKTPIATLPMRLPLAFYYLCHIGTVLLIVGLLALPVMQWITRAALSLPGMVCLVAELILMIGLRPTRWKTSNPFAPERLHGIRLAAQQVPDLSTLVDQLARDAGWTMPLKIYLSQDMQLQLIARNKQGKQSEQAYLMLGLGLFGVLSEAELSALILQQMASFLVGEKPTKATRLHFLRQRARQLLYKSENRLFIVDLAVTIYARWLLRLTKPAQAKQTLLADRFAADRLGQQPLCKALEKIELMRPLWQAYWQFELQPAIQRDTYLPIFEGFRLFCKASPKRTEIQTFLQAFPAQAEQHALAHFDYTPPFSIRLQALRGKSESGLPALGQCSSLLGGEATAEIIWYSQFETGLSNTCDWGQYARAVLPARIRAQFAQHWMNPSKLALTELINLTYQIDDLWEKIRPTGLDLRSPQAQHRACLTLLEDWIVACLLQRGFQIHLHPGLLLRLQRQETIVTPNELLALALTGSLKSSHLKQYDTQSSIQ